MKKYPDRSTITKKSLNRVGESMKTDSCSIDNIKRADEWRSSHIYPMKTFANTLRGKVSRYKTSDFSPIVAQRLKRMPTIINKLKRFDGMQLSRMHDIGGVRAILPDIESVRSLKYEYTDNIRLSHELVKVRDYIEEPKDDGYRGVHLIYRYKNTQSRSSDASQYNGLFIEIQMRSDLQHEWSTAVETVGIINNDSIKNGGGSTPWKKFFLLVSSAFALIEEGPPPKFYNGMDIKEIISEIKQLDAENNLLSSLRTISIGVNAINEENKDKSTEYVVLALDLKNKKITYTPFSTALSANSFYSYLEANHKYDDQVLVSVSSAKNVQRAFPNYFFDITKFIKRVELLMRNA
ncbi:MAG: hypothetical protein EOM35_03845 [Negativicutes bacterium]|nr:hypothetical protein [Negativicutes bacterium]